LDIELWKLVASVGGVLITCVTAPIVLLMKSEIGKLRAEIKADIAELKTDMTAMEARLNTRIDTRLIHR
jgi:hypothetical protein